jgi:hypothetical protein
MLCVIMLSVVASLKWILGTKLDTFTALNKIVFSNETQQLTAKVWNFDENYSWDERYPKGALLYNGLSYKTFYNHNKILLM